jgi:hypothetical protein
MGLALKTSPGHPFRAPRERSFWRGLKIAGKPRFEVHAFRCPGLWLPGMLREIGLVRGM